MNVRHFAISITVILTLLLAQIGKAMSAEQWLQHCDMQTMSLSGDVAQTEQAAASMDNMDCCDNASSASTSPKNCCDTQCECSSFVPTVTMLINKFKISHFAAKQNTYAFYSRNLSTPLLKQAQRPPIA